MCERVGEVVGVHKKNVHIMSSEQGLVSNQALPRHTSKQLWQN